jgi:osmotically-inducible protein OsmY
MSHQNVIVNEIRAALHSDPRLPHPEQVAVSEKDGTVTLRGSVGGFHQQRAAVTIAKSVSGVKVVEDELRVDPRGHSDDDEIRGAALQALMSNDAVPADRIEVKVKDGWLTLKGEVRHQEESDAAFAIVSGLDGVGGITNAITVVTAGIDG